MSSSGNLGTAKEIYRCGHITLYQNSHSDVFFSFFFLAATPGEPGTPAVEAQSLTHWTTREVPTLMSS